MIMHVYTPFRGFHLLYEIISTPIHVQTSIVIQEVGVQVT